MPAKRLKKEGGVPTDECEDSCREFRVCHDFHQNGAGAPRIARRGRAGSRDEDTGSWKCLEPGRGIQGHEGETGTCHPADLLL